MSKYKVGDKFIIEIEKVYESSLKEIDVFEDIEEPLYKMKGFNYLTFSNAELNELEKIDNDDIHVGDVVTIDCGDIKFVCTKDNSSGDYSKCHLLCDDGSVWECCEKSRCNKTGKRVEISNVLDQIDK